jgi:hypothetical protein
VAITRHGDTVGYFIPARRAGEVREAESAIVAPLAVAPEVSFRITPLRPVEDLRAEGLKYKPRAEEGTFRHPDLVELVKLDPTIRTSSVSS